MRIRVPRRFLLLGILLCSLALAASVPAPATAKPLPWDPSNGPDPGDGDGPVVKGNGTSYTAPSLAPTVREPQMTHSTRTTLSIWKAYLTALRLGYGWRWLW